MLTQSWTIDVTESRWLLYWRVGAMFLLAIGAGWTLAFVAGIVGVSGWWGDWLWPWPILLYLTWVVAFLPAPVLPASYRLRLTETGELGDQVIGQNLRTPWLIALRLYPLDTTSGAWQTTSNPQWVWVFRDQLTLASWARLNRVCQYSWSRPESTD